MDTAQQTGVAFAREVLTESLRVESDPFLSAHYDEVGYSPRPIDPDWSWYFNLQAVGLLRVFTMRVDEALVGYATYFIVSDPHNKARSAVQDMLYVVPSARGRGRGLMRYAVDSMLREGLSIVATAKSEGMERVLAHMGFRSIGRLYRLENDNTDTGERP